MANDEPLTGRDFRDLGPSLDLAFHATLNAELPTVEQSQAEALVAKAHTVCPCSKATRGNIRVTLLANGKAVG